MNRRNFLYTTAGTAAGAMLGSWGSSARAAAPVPKNLILVYASGGWDPAYVLDPKPGSPVVSMPAGRARSYGSDLRVWIDDSRPNIAAFFDAWAPVTAVVNGISVNSISHQECRQRMLTGTRSETSPDVAALAAFELGWDLPAPYLVLGPSAFTGDLASGAARLGNMNQIVALLDPPAAAAGPYPAPGFVPSSAEEAAIRQWIEGRANRVGAIRATSGRNQRRLADFLDSLDRGDLLRQNATGFGTIGQTLSLAAQRVLAVEMLRNGISATVHLDTTESWDSHDGINEQGRFNDALYRELKGLADDLASRPGRTAGNNMLDETVVAVVSEMGRTPRANGSGGKDHWPTTSALVFGGGIAGGRSLGATSDGLQPRRIDLATGAPDDGGRLLGTDAFLAGLLTSCGVDAGRMFPYAEPFRAIVKV